MDTLQAIALLREQGLIPEAEADRLIKRVRAEGVIAAAKEAAIGALPQGWVIVSIMVEDPEGNIYGERAPRPSRPRERVDGGVRERVNDPDLIEFAKRYAQENNIKWYGVKALMKSARFRDAARAAGFSV